MSEPRLESKFRVARLTCDDYTLLLKNNPRVTIEASFNDNCVDIYGLSQHQIARVLDYLKRSSMVSDYSENGQGQINICMHPDENFLEMGQDFFDLFSQ